MNLFDRVAVLNGSGDPEIRAGDVGTVVELLSHGGQTRLPASSTTRN